MRRDRARLGPAAVSERVCTSLHRAGHIAKRFTVTHQDKPHMYSFIRPKPARFNVPEATGIVRYAWPNYTMRQQGTASTHVRIELAYEGRSWYNRAFLSVKERVS